MAASSVDAPCVNTASGLLAELDLNKRPSTNDHRASELHTPATLLSDGNRNMEGVDFDPEMEVPDTPDRLAAKQTHHDDLVEENGSSSVVVISRNDNLCKDGNMNSRSRLVNGNGRNRGLHFFSRKNLESDFSNSFALDSSSTLRHSHIIRRGVAEGAFKHEEGQRNGAIFSNQGKGLSTTPEERKGPRETSCLYLNNPTDSSTRSVNSLKGKEKMEDNSFSSTGMDKGKAYNTNGDPKPKPEKVLSASMQSIMPSRVTGRKRLVRNGCISPYNIAKARALPQRNSKDIKDAEDEWNDGSKSEPIDLSHGVIGSTSGSGGIYLNLAKEKGIQIQTEPSKDHEAGNANPSERAKIANSVREDDAKCIEELAGWVSTRNRSKPKCSPLEKRDEMIHRENRNGNHHHEIPDTDCQHAVAVSAVKAQTSSSRSVSQGVNRWRHAESGFTKRQKKHGSTSGSAECSTSALDDSEIFCLGSSGGPSNTRLTRNLDNNHRRNLDSIIEIDEFSPDVTCLGDREAHGRSNDNINARARQVEADEILARELQEQLYNEGPTLLDGKMDAQLARMLQGQEEECRALSVTHHYDEDIARMLQRSSDVLHPPSRQRHAVVDPRMRVLEELEAAVGDHSDAGAIDQLLQLQRDFNENDYEMLLALDDNNHQHVGASSNQINSLPQSTVQTDNFEEVCTICLETPSTGDTIRHLPCLHKFHKDMRALLTKYWKQVLYVASKLN
ncbi:hypothetical protein RJ641_021569 [Dillenia turbinata]|uniref:RING-type domain-containing protein n=1 Tax=Dillenia turbinata TaxID=194707 RepID=A0AAN8UPW6_9MAGN